MTINYTSDGYAPDQTVLLGQLPIPGAARSFIQQQTGVPVPSQIPTSAGQVRKMGEQFVRQQVQQQTRQVRRQIEREAQKAGMRVAKEVGKRVGAGEAQKIIGDTLKNMNAATNNESDLDSDFDTAAPPAP